MIVSFQKFSVALLCMSVLFFYSCNKSVTVQDPTTETINALHNYGLQTMTPDQWAGVPVFDASVMTGKYTTNGLTYSGTLPTNYLLATPDVRDQGQIGSCTGFCGAETEEMLKFYATNPTLTVPAITVANGVSTATTFQIPSPSTLFGSASALSPLFLYYVERVVIQKQAISADLGANMVNIGQALQGTTTNTSTTPLTYGGVNFKGISTEDQYIYPSVINTNGYNIADSTSKAYLTAPSAAAISSATSYTLANQSGSTTSSNTTASGGVTKQGYYVITSTGSTLLNDVKTALVNKKPVMMGFNVCDNTKTYTYFEGLNKTSYTYNPLTSSGQFATGVRVLGGHAVPIVGYIDDKNQPGGGVVIVENSWGKPWGYNGFFYMPYSVLQSTKVVPSGSLYVAVL